LNTAFLYIHKLILRRKKKEKKEEMQGNILTKQVYEWIKEAKLKYRIWSF